MSDLSLSTHYFPVTFTAPTGTARTAPATLVVPVGATLLTEVDLLIPPGHAGLTGFAVRYSGEVILPFRGTDPWIRGNDDHHVFDVSFPVGSGLTFLGYNDDVFDHSWYVRLKVDDNTYRATTTERGAGPIMPAVI